MAFYSRFYAPAVGVFLVACADAVVDEFAPGVVVKTDGGLSAKADAAASSPDGTTIVLSDGKVVVIPNPDGAAPPADVFRGPECPGEANCVAELQVSAGGTYHELVDPKDKIYEEHTCIVRRGDLFCWGGNSAGQVGDGKTVKPTVAKRILQNVYQVSAGGGHTCAVQSDGGLWCWGGTLDGQRGTTTGDPTIPKQIMSDVKSVSAGDRHTCAIKKNDSVWCWGNNSAGQTDPNSNVATGLKPAQIATGFKQVAAGMLHTCGVKLDGSLWCWGGNGAGKLGLGSSTAREPMQQVATNVALVRCGAESTIFADNAGAVWVMGSDVNGQLGLATTSAQVVPTQVPGLSNVTDIALGVRGYHSCAIGAGGMKCWGWKPALPLGEATPAELNVETPTLLASDALTVSAARQHACYTNAKSEVLCWGPPGNVRPGMDAPNSNPIVISLP